MEDDGLRYKTDEHNQPVCDLSLCDKKLEPLLGKFFPAGHWGPLVNFSTAEDPKQWLRRVDPSQHWLTLPAEEPAKTNTLIRDQFDLVAIRLRSDLPAHSLDLVKKVGFYEAGWGKQFNPLIRRSFPLLTFRFYPGGQVEQVKLDNRGMPTDIREAPMMRREHAVPLLINFHHGRWIEEAPPPPKPKPKPAPKAKRGRPKGSKNKPKSEATIG